MSILAGEKQKECPACYQAIPEDGSECPICAKELSSAALPLPTIPGYKIVSRLGEGGMGTVYLAEELDLGRKVAIKMISPKLSEVTLALGRFEREARVMATVEHPHIVRVYAMGHSGGRSFLVLEYIEGESLSDFIKRSERLSIPDALRILRQVVEGLAASWDKKIIHRDIKPSNILLDKNLDAHVTDFGLAKPIEMQGPDTISVDGLLAGTPYYIAPEQALGKTVDCRADIYSLGIVLYEMLTGKKPFDGHTPFDIVNQHLTRPLPSIQNEIPDVPERIVELLEWMTQKKVNLRPQSYSDLLNTIHSLSRIGSPNVSAFDTLSQPVVRLSSKKFPLPFWLLLCGVAFVTWVIFPNKTETLRPVFAKPATIPMVAVTPFYGPDQDSAKEGRVMAALIEKRIRDRLGDEVQVLGVDQTNESLRSHQAARNLGYKLGASVVIWGEAFAVRNETEIEPHFTMVPNKTPATGIRSLPASWDADPFASLTDRNPTALVLKSEAPNQIELRKTSAASIGDMVSLLTGIHALYTEKDPGKALSLFKQSPVNVENLYYRACALVQLQEQHQAIKMLEHSLVLDPTYAPAYALLGDLKLASGNFQEAVEAYKAAANTGQPYTASRALFTKGKLYTKETFRSIKYTDGKEFETSWLIAIDPDSGKVLRRYHLPGIPEAFTAHEDVIEILYDSGFGRQNRVVLKDGEMDVPLWGEEDLQLRIQSMLAGWVLPSNFLSDLESIGSHGQEKFEPREVLYEDVPQTLPELETALNAALERDPTQPWHLFFLGQSLWSQGRKQEAEQIWIELTTSRFSHVCYYEFSWMASFFESFGQAKWADFAYLQALQQRISLPMQANYSTFAERMVNANFIRTAAIASRNTGDLKRAHLWLNRARELTGICPDADLFAAQLWRNHFLKQGDVINAEKEKEFLQKAQNDPLSLIRATTLFDYSFYIWMSATVAFILVILLLLSKASQLYLTFRIDNGIAGKQNENFRRLVFVFLCVLGVITIRKILSVSYLEMIIVGICMFTFLGAILYSQKIAPIRILGSISSKERKVFVIAFLLVVISLGFTVYYNSIVQSVLNRPLIRSDIRENPLLLEFMEEKLKESNTPNIRFITAVLNHKAGQLERAKELYRSNNAHPFAQQNLAALQNQNDSLIQDPSPEEFRDAFVNVHWKTFLENLWYAGKGVNIFYSNREMDPQADAQGHFSSTLFQLVILFTVGLILLFLLVPPMDTGEVSFSDNRIKAFIGKTISLVVPGAFDIQRDHPLRGYFTLILFLVALCALTVLWMIPPHFPVPGVATFLQAPTYLQMHPLPGPIKQADMPTIIRYHFWSIFWAYPYAKVFLGFVLVAGLSALSLHFARLRTIWRSI